MAKAARHKLEAFTNNYLPQREKQHDIRLRLLLTAIFPERKATLHKLEAFANSYLPQREKATLHKLEALTSTNSCLTKREKQHYISLRLSPTASLPREKSNTT